MAIHFDKDESGLKKLLGIARKGRRSSWSITPKKDTNRAGEGSEHAEQCEVVRWCRQHEQIWPGLKRLYAIPSGEKRHIAVANRLRAEGVQPGIPDLCLAHPRGIYAGLFIEMKKTDSRPKRPSSKGPVSDEQHEWIIGLIEEGYRVVVCYGAEEAIRELEGYLSIPKIK